MYGERCYGAAVSSASTASSGSSQRRWWLWVLLFVLLLPVLLCLAAVASLAVSMRAAASRADAFCARYPVGAPAAQAELEQRARAEGFAVERGEQAGGRAQLEVTAGVLYARYVCRLGLQGGRVVSRERSNER